MSVAIRAFVAAPIPATFVEVAVVVAMHRCVKLAMHTKRSIILATGLAPRILMVSERWWFLIQ
jgi:hypothetical protein